MAEINMQEISGEHDRAIMTGVASALDAAMIMLQTQGVPASLERLRAISLALIETRLSREAPEWTTYTLTIEEIHSDHAITGVDNQWLPVAPSSGQAD